MFLRHVFRNDAFRINCNKNFIPLLQACICQRPYHVPSQVYERDMKLMKKDEVSLGNELIYCFDRPKLLVGGLATLNFVIIALPLVGLRIHEERNGLTSHTPDEIMNLLGESVVYFSETECYIAIVTSTVFALFLHRLCALNTLRIYWDHRCAKYTAIFLNSFFPWKREKHEFNAIQKRHRSALMNGKRAILHIEYFKKPSDYSKFCNDKNVPLE